MVPKLCLLASAALLLTGAAWAGDYTWTNAAGGTFVGNFAPGGTPVSAVDTTLIFPDLLALPTGYTALNNLGSFTLNAIHFDSLWSNNSPAVTVSAGAAAGFTLRFAANGATQPSILVNGTGSAVIQNGSATTGITLSDGTNLTIGGSGLGNLTLSATIGQVAGGVGAMTYNSTAPFTLGSWSTVTVSGANSYTGGTSIVSGNLVVANNFAFGTGPVTINGNDHSLAVNGGLTISNSLVLNQSLRLALSYAVTFAGSVSGPGGLIFENSTFSSRNASSPLFTFTGAGTASGPLNIGDSRGARLGVNFAGASGTTQYSSFVVGPTSVLTFDNTNATRTRVNATAPPLTLRSGTVKILGENGSGNVVSETFGLLTASGLGVLTATPGGSSTATLHFASLTRELNATLDFSGTNLGGSGNNTANFVFAANPGGAVNGILPYAVAATNVTSSSRTLARYDGATGRIVPLNVAADYNPVDLYVANQSSPGANFRRAGTTSAPNAGGAAGLVGAVTANAVVLENTSLAGSATLTVISGCLVQSSDSFGSTGYVNLGGLNFGANPAYFHSLADQVINAPIFGSGGGVKSGAGTLTLTNANPFSGGLTINGGTVSFASEGALGAAGGGITLNVAEVSSSSNTSGLVFAQNLVNPSPVTTLTTTRPITVGPVGGSVFPASFNATLTIAGSITGSGPLTIGSSTTGSSGLVVLSGANSNTGPLLVAGTVAVASDAVLGAPSAPLSLQGRLRVDESFATSRPVDLGGTIVLPPGRSLQLDGPVTGGGVGVVGGGELVVTSASSFRGSVSIGDIFANRDLLAAMPAGVPPGATLTLRGPNGAMPLAGGTLQVSQAGTIHLDNSGPAGNANLNRLGGGRILLSGGELKLTGNAAVSVTESIGSLTSDQFLGTVTLGQPDSGGAGRLTAIVATGYSKGTSATLRDVLFIRGTNLGAATGDRTALLLNSDPVPVNGLIEAVVVATSATSSPTDFAAATPVGGQFAVTPFTAYAGPAPATGGSSAATYDNSSVSIVTGIVAANALRLSAGGGVQMGAGTSLSLDSGMLLALPGNTGISGGTVSTTKPLRVINAGDLTIGTAAAPTTVSANNGFVKAGAGRLTLYGTASTTLGNVTGSRATVTIAEGTLALGNAQALVNSTVNGVTGALPDFRIDSRATLDLSALPSPVRIRALYGSGSVQLGPAGVQIGTQQSQFAGSLVGPMSATFIVGAPQSEAAGNTFGSEVQLLGDNSGFAGGFTILRGTLGLWGSRSAGSGTGPIILGDTSGTGHAGLSLGAVLSLNRDIIVRAGATPSTPHALLGGGGVPLTASSYPSTQTVSGNIALGQTLQIGGVSTVSGDLQMFFTGIISGPGGLRQSNVNTIFTGDNTFTGGFTGDFGVVGLGSNSTATTGPLGTGPVQLDALFGGTFLAYGGSRVLSNPISTTGTSNSAFTVVGLNDLTFNGSFNYSTLIQPLQLTSTNAGVTTFAGPIAGSRQLQKSGPGTVVFANPTGNTYSGGTVVDAGTLIAANTSGSATGAGAVTVNPGAILGGAGSVAGATTLTTGGILRPGASETVAGTLTIGGNVTVQDRAILSVTVNGSTAGKVQLSGGFFDLTGANSLTVYATGSAPMSSQSFTIVDSGAIPIAFFNGAFSPANFNVSANFPFANLFLTSPTPTILVLNYTPVPEPTGILFAVVAAAWATRRIGRRKNGVESH